MLNSSVISKCFVCFKSYQFIKIASLSVNLAARHCLTDTNYSPLPPPVVPQVTRLVTSSLQITYPYFAAQVSFITHRRCLHAPVLVA